MYGLPPQEIATIDRSQLQEASVPWYFQLRKDFADLLPSFSTPPTHLPYLQAPVWFALSFVALVPAGVMLWAQPNTPNLKANAQQSTSAYVAQQQKPGNPVASNFQETTVASTTQENSPDSTETTTADLASVSGDNALATSQNSGQNGEILSAEEKAYRYHLTVAQGFLRRAIQFSQDTSQGQTAEDQAEIFASLEQALASVNTAIDLDPTGGLGFLLRARIYKTASAIKPEFSAKADQDLLIAQGLGVKDVDILDENALDQLPTQQANLTDGGAVIADTEEGSQTAVQTETSNNAQNGEIVFPAGQTEITVPFTALTDTMKITLEISASSEYKPHTPFRVSSRKSGEGFTIQSFNSLEKDVTLVWSVVE